MILHRIFGITLQLEILFNPLVASHCIQNKTPQLLNGTSEALSGPFVPQLYPSDRHFLPAHCEPIIPPLSYPFCFLP